MLKAALSHWDLQDAHCEFVAGRENQVYRVTNGATDVALRIKRPGYRDRAELVSELQWLSAMEAAGLGVPRPLPSRNGQLLEEIDGFFVDMVGWLPGRPLGRSREPLQLDDREGVFRALGAETARLHAACDDWQRSDGFRRCDWDMDGLVGEVPVWGRFWDNPTLSPDVRGLFMRFRHEARERLSALAAGLDHGLIHADLVRENVLLHGGRIAMIDFDDGGFGYRQFDLATVLLKNMAEPDYPALKTALLDGYTRRRSIDLDSLEILIVLRALSYVGWIISRINEPGGRQRNERFVLEAQDLCTAFFQQR